jgi:hypothetical protein
VKRTEIAFQELACLSDVIEILEKEETAGLCWHGTSSEESRRQWRN